MDAKVHADGPHPTVFLFNLVTERAREWWAANVEDEGPYLGCAPCVEHRYAADIVAGMQRDGLEVQ